jgi:hypothetical protein
MEKMDDEDSGFEIITLADDDNDTQIDFAVLANATYNDINYLLVQEADTLNEDDAYAEIIKVVGADDDDDLFEFVEDEDELKAVAGLFQENDNFEIQF